MPVLAVLLTLTCLQWTPLPVALTWFATAVVCLGLQFALCRAYFKRDRSRDEQRDWIGMLSASELLIGMCWCLPLFLFWNGATAMQQIYLIASIMAVIAVRLLVVNSFMPVLIAGTGVTDAFRMYLRPLLGSGMPEAHLLRLNPVEKVLKGLAQ